jgi:hypothetical protein
VRLERAELTAIRSFGASGLMISEAELARYEEQLLREAEDHSPAG